MPLFHIHGLIGALLSSAYAGASVVCPPRFAARPFFTWLNEFHPTWFTAVPTMHQAILAHAPDDLHHQKRPTAADRHRPRLCPLGDAETGTALWRPGSQSYGMTEASHQMASNPLPPRIRKPGSVGLAAGPEISILDSDDAPLAPGCIGEIAIRGASVTAGYANHAEANQTAFCRGWFRTGDQGYLDDEGYLFLTGRLKEMINRGGEKIAPREINGPSFHPASTPGGRVCGNSSFLGRRHRCRSGIAGGCHGHGGGDAGFYIEQLAAFRGSPRKLFSWTNSRKVRLGKFNALGWQTVWRPR